MEFSINADIFLRLSHAALQPDETHSKYDNVLRAVRIEYRDGVGVAIATCGQILVAECLDECGENGEINVVINSHLLEIAAAERNASGRLIITQAPGWSVARGIETNRMCPVNAELVGEWPDWRDLVPKELPSKFNASFMLEAGLLARMARTSPSGVILFPKFADKEQPIVLRDKIDPNWFGLIFIDKDGCVDMPPVATIPEWVK